VLLLLSPFWPDHPLLIRLVELMLRLEEEGIEIPLEEAWNVETVEDAYRLYTGHSP